MRTTLAMCFSLCLATVSGADDPAPKWSPAADLTAMQGKWQLPPDRTIFNLPHAMSTTVLPDANAQLSELRLEGNRLYLGQSKEPVALANDVTLPGLRVAAEGHHLLCVTFPDGRMFTGSYQLKDGDLTIRFPETCTCNRTGMIAHYVRPKK